MIKAVDIAWLEFEKPDLTRSEAFATAFGFQVVHRRPDEVQLRGTRKGAPCVIVRRGPHTRFTGAAFRAGDEADVRRLADNFGTRARQLPESHRRHLGRSDRSQRHGGPGGRRHARTSGADRSSSRTPSTSETTCSAPTPPNVRRGCPRESQRLGHLVVQSTKYLETLNWYLDNLGMIVSDFLFFPGQRDAARP